jgi:hypothetical protein
VFVVLVGIYGVDFCNAAISFNVGNKPALMVTVVVGSPAIKDAANDMVGVPLTNLFVVPGRNQFIIWENCKRLSRPLVFFESKLITAVFELQRSPQIAVSINDCAIHYNVMSWRFSDIFQCDFYVKYLGIDSLSGFFDNDVLHTDPGALVYFHDLKLALHNFKLLVCSIGLPTGIDRQRESQICNSGGCGSGDSDAVPIEASYESPEGQINKALSVLGSLAIIGLGYLLLAWGGGVFLSWRNPVGLIGGVAAIATGLACLGHGFWSLVH